ncbi:pyridoxamine 5'-phosphate oxidase family protein [Sulfitobacter sp. D35]|uniref:pyridoxamine 5'-phosphate oxidase family protein n=1 Tax=Sulfitobacter sp. D35 TaxID=3083252 RepID=UPI00296F01D4|nr:pyridoxamine 5'-phosphate oxidase family protein [Sulfitobacter sp. D35]MDW4496913.1 pyridoxamine 5'-phosphate oxidase family protein [Sulfitobacter sp. D35]
MTTDLKQQFWERIGDVRAGMLAAGDHRAVPMSHFAMQDDNALWFVTADGTGVADAAKSGQSGEYVIGAADAQLYARVDGRLEHVTDREKLEQIWSPIAAAWFEDGKEDEDVCLVRFSPASAEVWTTDGGAKFLYEIAKANLSDDKKPDIGDHGTVSF